MYIYIYIRNELGQTSVIGCDALAPVALSPGTNHDAVEIARLREVPGVTQSPRSVSPVAVFLGACYSTYAKKCGSTQVSFGASHSRSLVADYGDVLIPLFCIQDNLYTKEEMKVTWETRKILGVPDMPVR